MKGGKLAPKCFYCLTRDQDPKWAPYCGPECALPAEADSRQGAFCLRDIAPSLYPIRESARRRAKDQRRCWPKEQHRTKGAAEAQMRSIVRRGLAKNLEKIHVYVCPHCRCYHVGHGL